MKRITAIITLIAIILVMASGTAHATTGGLKHKTMKTGKVYTTSFYKGGKCIGKVKTNKRVKVKTYKGNLTAKTLETRKNRCIVVEVIDGKCINGKGDGKTSDGHYISYKRVKGHKRGAKYTTYCVYGNNNYIDDVVIRADFRR